MLNNLWSKIRACDVLRAAKSVGIASKVQDGLVLSSSIPCHPWMSELK